jgi:hypothetical protein
MPLITSLSASNLGLTARAALGVTTISPPPTFEFQAIGGGAGGPTSQAGGGGGAGALYQDSVYVTYPPYSNQIFKVTIGLAGIGKTTTDANSTVLEGGVLINGVNYSKWVAYYGGWGATYGSSGFPSSTFGSTGGGTYTPATNILTASVWPPGSKYSWTSSGIVYANIGGAAGLSTNKSSGGGGGAGGPGSPGISNTVAGAGGPGMLDWTGTYVCYGGGGVPYYSGIPITPLGAGAAKPATTYSGGTVPAAVLASASGLPNTGGGGSWGGRGGSGKFILRYPASYRQLDMVTGTYTYYKSGGYHYYVWTGDGTFRVSPG